jgi:FkbM family methyltransferase
MPATNLLGVTPWSSIDVLVRLLRDAAGPADRRWLVAYFLARRLPETLSDLLPAQREDGALRLRKLAAPLHLAVESGGLATYYEIALRRVYSPAPEWIPGPGQTVVDVGANIGVFALWAAGPVGSTGRLVAVEPNPKAATWLQRNVEPFGGRATVCEVACGEREAQLELMYPPNRLSVGSFLPRDDRTEVVSVPVRRLDDLLDEQSIGPIDLLKIDVEGVEAAVLRGAKQSLARTRRLALEVAGTDLAEATELIRESGLEPRGQVCGMWGLPAEKGVVAYFARSGS